jgi:hypothetical protein
LLLHSFIHTLLDTADNSDRQQQMQPDELSACCCLLLTLPDLGLFFDRPPTLQKFGAKSVFLFGRDLVPLPRSPCSAVAKETF